VIFAGGGTAGHLVPGLTAAQQLLDELPGLRITFATAGKPLERELIAAASFPLETVPCRPGPRGWRDLVPCAWHNLRGYFKAQQLLKRLRPRLVIGLGGYASLAVASAAARRGVPLVLLEQNVIPGRATRLLAPFARVVCTSFLETADRLPRNCRVRLTGNPVRAGFAQRAVRVDAAHAGPECLVVLGGSGGAHALNEQVPRALAGLGSELTGWRVVHQCGAKDVAPTRALYSSLGIAAEVTSFVADMPKLLSRAALVISRAGGTTLAELAAAGVPAVVVPYPHAADNHQFHNAQRLAAGGACVLLDERQAGEALAERLRSAVGQLAANPAARQAMAAAMLRQSRPTAASDVVRILRETAGL
jgi:UDP-N-acetylglucosamine--N-acetylmuramyl-(pentapeptide) pyrophosphoryl-undecaprenol N-acetylglucosamine transferase